MKLCFKCLKTDHEPKSCKIKSRLCYYCSQKHNVLFCKARKEEKRPVCNSFLPYINRYFENENYLSDHSDTSEDSRSTISNSKCVSKKGELISHDLSYNCRTVSLPSVVVKNKNF